MTPLPPVIRKAGFELRLIRRIGRAAIYRQHLLGGNPDHDAYEVILAQIRTTNHKGEPEEPYEAYPAAESWGKKGWTFTGLAKAVQKLKQLAQKASRAGTVSRKNRLDGRGAIITRGLRAKAPRLMVPSKNFARSVGQRHQSPLEGKAKTSLGNTVRPTA
jgi:hypothetical protein